MPELALSDPAQVRELVGVALTFESGQCSFQALGKGPQAGLAGAGLITSLRNARALVVSPIAVMAPKRDRRKGATW
ncbi:hypothetical protein [Aromatoleum aromaticum]|uniref:hypothetical protein n=1 Tax=Aromatoleum aromaticum TaxID=551760 RepID=UPI0002EE14D6|nr:hypothetical protein [Aromatoleum aromaticum]NMG56878.1 hypothetical protein [Aromatoleum aromaticum]